MAGRVSAERKMGSAAPSFNHRLRPHSLPGIAQIQQCRTFLSSLRGSKPPMLRFAPSPTGQLHLGGLRTALFNHLFARKAQGKWILRIEDTDQKRFVPGSSEAMQDILAWSGLQYDEGPDRPGKCGPFHQSQRLHLYSSYAQRLIDTGAAYRDFRPETERGASGTATYTPPSLEEEKELVRNGQTYILRLRMAKTTVSLEDLVYGKLTFPYDETVEDPVLVKSDGWPTYHLASIVDDHEMGVTHVLRGEEWLPSIPIHLNLYQALKIDPPRFAHLPLLVNADGSKLSKRHADVHVESYRQNGYEPEALLNFVALMGYNWHASEEEKGSADGYDTSEVFTVSDMVEKFDPARISHSRANPNLGKLLFLNKQHLMRKIKSGTTKERKDLAGRLMEMTESRWPDETVTGYLSSERVLAMADLFAGRADTAKDLVSDFSLFFDTPDWTSSEAQALLSEIDPLEYERVVWTAHDFISSMHGRDIERLPYLEAALRDLTSLVEKSRKSGNDGEKKRLRGKAALMKPLRLALSGKKSGPTVSETISLLGQAPTLARLEAAMQHLADTTQGPV